MQYTTRMGSGARRAHVNYQCPCGCVGGVIYNSEKPLAKAGACCCGRRLWVGTGAEAKIRSCLEEGVDYEWDLGSVTMPWGEVAQAAMAWPRSQVSAHAESLELVPLEVAGGQQVKDVVCGMTIDPRTAAATSEYRNETFYFCATACKTRFDSNPRQYIAASKGLLDRIRGR